MLSCGAMANLRDFGKRVVVLVRLDPQSRETGLNQFRQALGKRHANLLNWLEYGITPIDAVVGHQR